MLAKQAIIFLFIGGCTVAVDYAIYTLLITSQLNTNIAKGISFLLGTIFAYFANKKITFNYTGSKRFHRFLLIYSISLIINIFMNAVCLSLLPQAQSMTNLAFVFATGSSAIFNFLGMKYFAFK